MVKPRSFRPSRLGQTLLLPPSPVEWLPENYLVFFLLDLAVELDLEAIHRHYEPDQSRISDFRRRHLDALTGLFVQVLRRYQRAGLVSLGPGRLMARCAVAVPPANERIGSGSWRLGQLKPQAW